MSSCLSAHAPVPPSRRFWNSSRSLGGVLVATMLLAGCTGTSSDDAGTSTVDGGAFPVTLDTAYGDVTIQEKPDRVATLGYADVALASALGADVVVAPESFSTTTEATQDRNLPYIEPLGDDTTWINPMEISVEEVAAAEPDVILATAAFSLDDDLYSRLSDIAPVVTYEETLYGESNDESARRVGTALGEDDVAEELIRRADDSVADLRRQLPNLDGGTFLYGQARDGVVVMLVDDANVTVRFMQELGLVAVPAVADLDGPGAVPGSVDVSIERASMFNDAGVLFMTFQSEVAQEAFEKSPIVAAQPIMSTRYAPVDLETATALQDPNVVAVPWLLNQLRPGLELIP